MRSLYWFRSDLRVADNLAFIDAVHASECLIAVFILTPQTWKAHYAAPCKIRFLLAHLKVLSESLWKRGIPLLIREGPSFSDCPRVLEQLCDEYRIDAVYFTHEYPLDEKKRDQAVSERLGRDRQVYAYHQQLVLPPGTVLSKQNTPFQVFTPFKNAWLIEAEERQAWRTCRQSRKTFESIVNPDFIPNKLEGFTGQPLSFHWEVGEKNAQKYLKEFCQDKLSAYQQHRDILHLEGTSRLSPYLALGIISVRQCITAALAHSELLKLEGLKNHTGAATWIAELIWRDFYYHIVHFYPHVCRHKPFRLKTDKIPWCDDADWFEAWKMGETGFPIVDAGMRQLAQMGWMHNRLRMVTAMFLSKILLLDWRLGERYFMENLIDGDFAANNGGWQWCASVGTDAAPYFRIFNPTLQSQRFDPHGDFIKQFCPELSHLDSKTIHAPFASRNQKELFNYPRPMVDYTKMRNRTLGVFKKL